MTYLSNTKIEEIDDLINEKSKEGIGYYDLTENEVKEAIYEIIIHDLCPYILFHPNMRIRANLKITKGRL